MVVQCRMLWAADLATSIELAAAAKCPAGAFAVRCRPQRARAWRPHPPAQHMAAWMRLGMLLAGDARGLQPVAMQPPPGIFMDFARDARMQDGQLLPVLDVRARGQTM